MCEPQCYFQLIPTPSESSIRISPSTFLYRPPALLPRSPTPSTPFHPSVSQGGSGGTASGSKTAADLVLSVLRTACLAAQQAAEGSAPAATPAASSAATPAVPMFLGLQAAALDVMRSSRVIEQMCLAQQHLQHQTRPGGGGVAHTSASTSASASSVAAAFAVGSAMAEACMYIGGVSVLSPQLRDLYEGWFVPLESQAVHEFTRSGPAL